MSRGALLLRAAEAGKELAYEPVAGRDSARPAAAQSWPAGDDTESATSLRSPVQLPTGSRTRSYGSGDRTVQLTNLDKIFWPEAGSHQARSAPVLRRRLPGAAAAPVSDRAMVMKRYPNGIQGKCFFMKRTPSPRPEWLETCEIEHESGNVIAFPMVQDLASLLWVINLGCIDLNQWYARCDDTDRPDYLHFDLDPGAGAGLRAGAGDRARRARRAGGTWA